MSASSSAIRVRAWGEPSAPPVLVLHGGPGAPGSVAALARVVAERFHALEPLQRRADASAARPLTVASHVADLAAVAPPRAALVGWSWGAMLALSYAALHPERAQALVLVGCGTYSLASRTEYQRRMAARYGAAERAREEELRAALAAASDPAERDALLGRWGALAEAAQAYALDDAAPRADDALAFDAAGHRETWDDALRLQAEGTEPARFAAIRCPVTLLHGADDPHPGALVRDDLLQCVPRLEYVELARCGHQPWRERHAADRFRAELLARLARAHGAE